MDKFFVIAKKIAIPSLIAMLFFGLSAFLVGMQLAILSSGQGSGLHSSYESLRSLLEKCDAPGDRSLFFRCVEQKASPFLDKYTLSDTMSALEEVLTERSKESPRGLACHDVAHIFGEAGFEQSKDLGETVVECKRRCGYGCIHGAANAAIRENPELIKDLNTICDRFSKASFPGQDLTACHHGLGHGLAEFARLDMVEALNLCDFFNSDSARAECSTGVFMEIIDSPTLKHDRFELPDDIPDFCESLPNFYKEICLANAGAYEFHRSHDIKKALSTCETLPADLYRKCNVGLGSDFHFMFTGDTGKIWQACNLSRKDQRESCIEGALISGFVNDPSGNLGIALCRQVDENIRSACFAYVGGGIKEIHGPDKAKDLCGTLISEERHFCLSDIK